MNPFYVYYDNNGRIICRSFWAYPPPECSDQDFVYTQYKGSRFMYHFKILSDGSIDRYLLCPWSGMQGFEDWRIPIIANWTGQNIR